MRRKLIRLAKALVAVALLAGLYRAANWRDVLQDARDLDAFWLGSALLLFVPQTLVSALRWRGLVQPLRRLTVGESVRQTLAASAINLVAPSKLGDLSKAGMLGIAGTAQAGAAALAVSEKAADVAALALFWAAGAWGLLPALGMAVIAGAPIWLLWLWARHTSPTRKRGSTAAEPAITREPESVGAPPSLARRASVLLSGVEMPAATWAGLGLWSVLLWSLHLAQIGLFLRAASVEVGFQETIARVPPAIFAGLLPLTLWGVGTRDAVLIHGFADLAPASTMAVVGMLTALRYVVPGAAGIALVPAAFAERARPEKAVDPLRPTASVCASI